MKLEEEFIHRVTRESADMAADNMLYPKSDPFGHGIQCGQYQGLQRALAILVEIMRDDEDKEKNS
jgi:hypothetical protein